jgi:putative phage-type endonuclease
MQDLPQSHGACPVLPVEEGSMNRQGRIGGSTVAAILGISPGTWSSPWSEWARIVGLRPESDDTERFAIGRDLEAGLAVAFTRKTGLHIGGEQMEIVHPRHSMFVGHIDGLAFEGPRTIADIEDAVAVVEHKTQFGRVWDEVPAPYQAQAQFYMWITGLDRCLFSVLFSGFKHEVYELKADRSDQALIAFKAWRFWRDHCVTGVPPEVDGSEATERALAEVYPKHEPGKRVAIDGLVPLLSRRTELKALESALTKLAEGCDEIDNRIKAAMGDAELATVDGEPVFSLRTQTRKEYVSPEATYRVLRPASKKDKESA